MLNPIFIYHCCIIFTLVLRLDTISANISLDDPNVCIRNGTVSVSKIITKTRLQVARKLVLCASFSLNCIETYAEVVSTSHLSVDIRIKQILECCSGYNIDENNKSCIPFCIESCDHGKCVRPDYCKCDVGYSGYNCDIHMVLIIIIIISCIIVTVVIILMYYFCKRRKTSQINKENKQSELTCQKNDNVKFLQRLPSIPNNYIDQPLPLHFQKKEIEAKSSIDEFDYLPMGHIYNIIEDPENIYDPVECLPETDSHN